MMVKFGSIYYNGSVLIKHLCEHDSASLLLPHSKWQNFTDLYRFDFMGLAKKHSFLTASIFKRSINTYEHLLCFENVP